MGQAYGLRPETDCDSGCHGFKSRWAPHNFSIFKYLEAPFREPLFRCSGLCSGVLQFKENVWHFGFYMTKQVNPVLLMAAMVLVAILGSVGTHIAAKLWNKEGADSNAIAGQIGDSAGFVNALFSGASGVLVFVVLKKELNERERERKRKLTVEVFDRFFSAEYIEATRRLFLEILPPDEVEKQRKEENRPLLEGYASHAFMISNVYYASKLAKAKEIDVELARALGVESIEGSIKRYDVFKQAAAANGNTTTADYFESLSVAFKELRDILLSSAH
jgi:hypothetical protein